MTDQIHSTTHETPQVSVAVEASGDKKKQIVIGFVAILLLVCIITALILLLTARAEVTAQIRDVFIIVMAFESLLVGFVLTILIVQLAKLTNLLQNEIKPILLSINETISTLRGTSAFLSDNLAEPVIKLNSYLAGLGELLSLIGFSRKSGKKLP